MKEPVHTSEKPNVARDAARSPRRFTLGPDLLAFLSVWLIAMLYAFVTNHAWEDWYITYRASKNLAIGNGLVFYPGERVHSFTSPIGTLLPAALVFLTGCADDDLVLWLFRLVSSLTLGGTALLLLRIARMRQYSVPTTFMLIGLLAFDPKIVGFSVNGMETAYFVFFIVFNTYAILALASRSAWFLGVSWAGLMWTRPDGWVPGFALALGFLAFPQTLRPPVCRRMLLRGYVAAAAVAAAIYSPWVIWAWFYYGSPVPHTIIAKGLNVTRTGDIIPRIERFVTQFAHWDISLMPAYANFGGWPGWLWVIYQVPMVLCALYWLVPVGRPIGRALSLALVIVHSYLFSVIPFPFPWYLPSVIIIVYMCTSEIYEQILLYVRSHNSWKSLARVCYAIPFVAVAIHFGIFSAVLVQIRSQQAIIEDGHRKQIGLWLKAHATGAHDTVFLECLGYIGFYSGLKTFDFPGLSSPEMIAARRKLGRDDFADLIRELRPVWLVLRPDERMWVMKRDAGLLTQYYELAKTFDVSPEIARLTWLPGRDYLLFDQTFFVYKLRATSSRR